MPELLQEIFQVLNELKAEITELRKQVKGLERDKSTHALVDGVKFLLCLFPIQIANCGFAGENTPYQLEGAQFIEDWKLEKRGITPHYASKCGRTKNCHTTSVSTPHAEAF